MYIFWNPRNVPIKIVPFTTWQNFMSAARGDIAPEFSLFIVDEERALSVDDVARDTPELGALGAREFDLPTACVRSFATIATSALVDDGTIGRKPLRTIVIAVFAHSHGAAVRTATAIAEEFENLT